MRGKPTRTIHYINPNLPYKTTNPTTSPDLHQHGASVMVTPFHNKPDRSPAMTFSLFGDKFTRHSGITRLMEDLNDGLRTPGAIMLGGGNPAQIPEMTTYFQSLLAQMLESGKATDALCNYDGPQGKTELLKLLADMLREELGWDIEPQNIALTNGSQSAFFYLFNLFAGRRADGTTKKVLFPLAPEYIGYADSGLEEDLFVSARPNIDLLP